MVDVGRLEEAQSVPAELDHLPVTVALHAAAIAPSRQVDVRAHGTAGEHRVRRALREAVHAAALVSLEVQQDDVGEPRRVEHLRDRGAHVLVHLVQARVDECRALVIDQKLVELKCGRAGSHRRGDAVDAAYDLVDSGHPHTVRGAPSRQAWRPRSHWQQPHAPGRTAGPGPRQLPKNTAGARPFVWPRSILCGEAPTRVGHDRVRRNPVGGRLWA